MARKASQRVKCPVCGGSLSSQSHLKTKMHLAALAEKGYSGKDDPGLIVLEGRGGPELPKPPKKMRPKKSPKSAKKTPKRSPNKAPKETTKKSKKEAVKGTKKSAKKSPKKTPKKIPKRAPKETPKKSAKKFPKQSQEKTPKKVPKGKVEKKPQALSPRKEREKPVVKAQVQEIELVQVLLPPEKALGAIEPPKPEEITLATLWEEMQGVRAQVENLLDLSQGNELYQAVIERPQYLEELEATRVTLETNLREANYLLANLQKFPPSEDPAGTQGITSALQDIRDELSRSQLKQLPLIFDKILDVEELGMSLKEKVGSLLTQLPRLASVTREEEDLHAPIGSHAIGGADIASLREEIKNLRLEISQVQVAGGLESGGEESVGDLPVPAPSLTAKLLKEQVLNQKQMCDALEAEKRELQILLEQEKLEYSQTVDVLQVKINSLEAEIKAVLDPNSDNAGAELANLVIDLQEKIAAQESIIEELEQENTRLSSTREAGGEIQAFKEDVEKLHKDFQSVKASSGASAPSPLSSLVSDLQAKLNKADVAVKTRDAHIASLEEQLGAARSREEGIEDKLASAEAKMTLASKMEADAEAKTIAYRSALEQLSQKEVQIAELSAQIGELSRELEEKGIQINDRDAELQEMEAKIQALRDEIAKPA